MKISKKYIEEYRTELGEQKPNLTKGHMGGLKCVKKRTGDEGDMIVICNTDKISKMAVTRRENYWVRFTQGRTEK